MCNGSDSGENVKDLQKEALRMAAEEGIGHCRLLWKSIMGGLVLTTTLKLCLLSTSDRHWGF